MRRRASKPVRHRRAVTPLDPNAALRAAAFIFDVEGTLVDSAMATLRCWRATLDEFGYAATLEELHRYSGMDGNDMLEQLLPHPLRSSLKKEILERQGRRYRHDYLPSVHALPRVRELFDTMKRAGCRLALATDCQKDELEHYLQLAGIAEHLDAIACGSDVKRGKPHPDLVAAARTRLRLRSSGAAVVVGDTPCDAVAARSAGMNAIGVLTGLFAPARLLASGCSLTFADTAALLTAFRAVRARDASSPPAAAAG